MATITQRPSELEQLGWYFQRGPHTQWDRFSPDQQAEMVRADLFAGRSVSLVLSSLITAGLVLSAVTLAVVLATS
jgi:hypothetical protein